MNQVSIHTLKRLLDNSEVIQDMSYESAQQDAEGNKVEARIKVDKKDEMRVIAYI